MISVLIPNYNYPCGPLLRELHVQLRICAVPFEIIVMEDGSTFCLEENQEIAEELNCQYVRLPQNIGRSSIRNRLASMAKYDWLLFMDCDSRIPSVEFMERYIKAIRNEKYSIICGGRFFGSKNLVPPQYLLHWTYGNKREPKPYGNNVGRAFLSNNFVIQKEVFLSVQFEESLKGYGHEDTLFGVYLGRKGFKILYIYNPVFHKGLDDNDAFLQKSRTAVANLRILREQFLHPEENKHIRLLNYYQRLHWFGLDRLLANKFDQHRYKIEEQLKSKEPNLYLFDLYKLGYLCKIMNADQPLQHKTDH